MRRITLMACAVALLPTHAAVAQDVPLSQLLLQFFAPGNPIVLAAETGHAAHFTSQTEAQATLEVLNKNIAYQLASFPLGSSSGGFTFTLDSSVGVLNRSSESFGPLYAERAVTAGKGKLTVGANYVHNHYDKFEGLELQNGQLDLTLTHQDTNADGTNTNFYFEGDVIQSRLFLDLKTDTFTAFATYGLGDRFDLGVAIPLVSVDVNARINAVINQVATSGDPFVSHIFPGNSLEQDFLQTGSASGIGDIVLRAKLGVATGESMDAALAADLRLPTGDDANLLGSGATQAKLFLILSGAAKKRFSPHLNLGYTFTGDSDTLGTLPDEINYTVGFDAAASSRFTVMADVVGRALLDADRLTSGTRTYSYRRANGASGTLERPEYLRETGTLNMVLGSAGFKFNPGGRLLISANVLFSLTPDNGLQDKITPVFAFDYNF